MPELLVEYASIENSKSSLSRVKSETAVILSQFDSIRSTLDWDVKCEQQIDAKLLKIHNHINTLTRTAGQHSVYLNNTLLKYMSTEQRLQGDVNGVQSSLYSDASASALIDFLQKFFPDSSTTLNDMIDFLFKLPFTFIPVVIIEAIKKIMELLKGGTDTGSGGSGDTGADSGGNQQHNQTDNTNQTHDDEQDSNPNNPPAPGTNPQTTVNGWLNLYSDPTVGGSGRSVEIPAGANPNKWAMREGLSDINYYAKKGQNPPVEVNIGGKGELTDAEGRYWVAVGPNVMNPNHDPSQQCTAAEMKYGSKIDVVLEDSNGNTLYVPAVVGDCKAHTYPTGIVQTGNAFPNGVDPHPQNNDGSIVEFCGKSPIAGLDGYKIKQIIVYDNKA